MPRVALPGLLVGLALFTSLLAAHGVREVAAVLRVAGLGLLLVAAFHVLPMVVDAIGWRRLLPPELRPSVLRMFWMRWLGESVNGLLPVFQVGGNIVKASLLARTGIGGAVAGATVVVDVTLVMLTQIRLHDHRPRVPAPADRWARARAAGRRRAGHHGQHPRGVLRRAAPGRVRRRWRRCWCGSGAVAGTRWSPAATLSMRRWRCSTASRGRSPRRAPGT